MPKTSQGTALTPAMLNKLDASLFNLFSNSILHEDERIPVVIRFVQNSDKVEQLVVEVGGTVRHRLQLLKSVAAWVPIAGVRLLARDESVNALELDHHTSVAVAH